MSEKIIAMNEPATVESVRDKFDVWFESECGNGLVDIKLAISNQRGVSASAVRKEILNIEALVKSERTKKLPIANTFLSPEIFEKIKAVII